MLRSSGREAHASCRSRWNRNRRTRNHRDHRGRHLREALNEERVALTRNTRKSADAGRAYRLSALAAASSPRYFPHGHAEPPRRLPRQSSRCSPASISSISLELGGIRSPSCAPREIQSEPSGRGPTRGRISSSGPINGLRQSNRCKGRHSADVLVPQMPYVQVYATELFSAGRASSLRRRISSLLHDMRAHRVRSRRLRGSPVSLLRVRLQRIHAGRCRVGACPSERPRPWRRSNRSYANSAGGRPRRRSS